MSSVSISSALESSVLFRSGIIRLNTFCFGIFRLDTFRSGILRFDAVHKFLNVLFHSRVLLSVLLANCFSIYVVLCHVFFNVFLCDVFLCDVFYMTYFMWFISI